MRSCSGLSVAILGLSLGSLNSRPLIYRYDVLLGSYLAILDIVYAI
jgi:hypothetical protein